MTTPGAFCIRNAEVWGEGGLIWFNNIRLSQNIEILDALLRMIVQAGDHDEDVDDDHD